MKIQSSPYKITDRTGATPNAIANASAILDLESTTKGLLIPRMTTANRLALGTIVVGLQVFDTTLNKLCVAIGTSAGSESNWFKVAKATLSKTFTLQAPTASDNVTIFRTDVAITIAEVIAVNTGTTPSTTFAIKYGTNRSTATGNLVASTTSTGTTTGNVLTIATASIPADSFIWIETTSASGTSVYLSIDIRYTEDN